MKKLVSIFVALSISLALPVYASTSNPSLQASAVTVTEEEINSDLLARGYPQLYLENTSFSAKKSLYEKPDLVFESAILTIYDEETGEFVDYEISENAIMPHGQIPTSSLALTWAITRDQKLGKDITVVYSYDWTKLPFFRWQDPIAVSWDDGKFEMKDNSFYKVDMYDGAYAADDGTLYDYFFNRIKSEENGYAKGFSSGVTWYADLVGQWPFVLTRLHGHGEFVLTRKVDTSGTSTIYGHYVHPTINIGVSINVEDYGSFSVSGGGSYDERGNQQTFSYYSFPSIGG